MISRYCPTVSVVIPVYNGEGTIEECISSVLALEYPRQRREIVIVDNGSTDGTRSILERYSGELTIVKEEVRGPAAARNRGIETARHEVIAFTDADCRVDRNWLAEIVLPLEDRSIGVAGGRILAKRPCNRVEAFGDRIHDHEKAITQYKPHYVITMNWASRSELLKKTLFDVAFIRGEDVDLTYRIQMAGFALKYVPDAIVYHSNERSLAGLFREGCQHGFWEVHTAKIHRKFIAAAGHRRLNPRTYRHLLRCLRGAVSGPQRMEALCDFVFNVGKKLGKYLGSVRFCHVEL